MLSAGDGGATRSGKHYLVPYTDRFPKGAIPELVQNSKRSENIDITDLFEDMAITPRKEKTLREYSAPSKNYIRNQIINLDSSYPHYNIDPAIILHAMQNTFSGGEDQDPGLHLSELDSYCDACKPKELTKEFVVLNIFKFSLAGKAIALPTSERSGLF